MGLAKKVVDYDVFMEKSGITVPEYRLIEGKLKLKKDGTPKKIVCNAKTGRSSWVDPIKNVEDIGKIIDYMNMRIENAGRADYERQWERNKLYFTLAVFSGFRVSDLVGARPGTRYKKTNKKTGEVWYEYPQWTGLRWCDLYEKDGITLRSEISIMELKTSNQGSALARTIELEEEVKIAIKSYVEKYPIKDLNSYVFCNRKNERLHADTIEDFIKEVTSACGLKGNYSTHSLRKTFVYQAYQGFIEDGLSDDSAIAECMSLTGHKSIQAFFKYLGIQRDNNKRAVKILGRRLRSAFDGKL